MRTVALLTGLALSAQAALPPLSRHAARESGSGSKDLIDWAILPGIQTAPSYKAYSGYIEVDPSHGKKVFYWFFESQDSPESDPVTFWTNGGPGCSGLLGLLTEHGPLLVRKPGDEFVLEPNDFSWNKRSNMVYIESPSGVGFSYSDTEEDYVTGDSQTAADNYNVITGFLAKFPHLKENDVYISSESYGGHYIPTLADQIVTRNGEARAAGRDEDVVKFKGLLVGNPYIESASNAIAQYDKYYGDSIVPAPVYFEWRTKCVEGGYKGSLPHCQALEARMDSLISSLNPYALDFVVCLDEGVAHSQQQRHTLRRHQQKARESQQPPLESAEANSSERPSLAEGSAEVIPARRHLISARRHLEEAEEPVPLPPYAPCAEAWIVTYLNQPEVKQALHVAEELMDMEWEQCSSRVQYSQTDMLVSMVPLFDKLLQQGEEDLKMLVFSGDDDAVCATQGTQWWVYSLGRDVREEWSPWATQDGQVAGFVTKFDGYTFVTVHDAGHEVPAYQPERAALLFDRFLDGSWFA